MRIETRRRWQSLIGQAIPGLLKHVTTGNLKETLSYSSVQAQGWKVKVMSRMSRASLDVNAREEA
jgi:hypothetical protein